MTMTDADLGQLLLDESYVTPEDLQKAQEQATQQSVSLKTALYDMGLLTQELYEGAVAEHYKLPFFDAHTMQPTAELVTLLPESVARAYGIVVVAREGDTVTIATS